MSLTVAPRVNLDALKNLRADKQYFLSSTTGEIKEASIWMRIKCAIGVSSARQKVSNLVDAVRTSLLDAAKLNSSATLETDIRAVSLKYMVEGSVIKDIANRFSEQNADAMAKVHAGSIISFKTRMLVGQLNTNHINFGDFNALEKIVRHAFKPQLERQLPMVVKDGKRVLDAGEFKASLNDAAKDVKDILDEIARANPAGGIIDNLYADHVIKTLFNEDGTRNGNPISSLKSKTQVQVEYTFMVKGQELSSRAGSVYDRLVEIGKKNGSKDFPAEMIEKLLGFCGNDRDLQEYVIEVAPELCMDSNFSLRTDDVIKAKIAAIKETFEEIRKIEKDIPGCGKMIKDSMTLLGSSTFPKGVLTTMAECVKSAKLNALVSLNSLSSADRICEGVEDIRKVVKEFAKRGKDYEDGGPIAMAGGGVIVAMVIAKAGPGFEARLPNIIKGTEFGKMLAFTSRVQTDLDQGNATMSRKKEAMQILEGYMKIVDFLVRNTKISCGEPLAVGEYADEDIDYNDESVGYMIGLLNELTEKA